jgi:hypothetical protein
MPSLNIGESGARARLAFRTLVRSAFESVAPSLGQSLLDYRLTIHTHPGGHLLLVRQHGAAHRGV